MKPVACGSRWRPHFGPPQQCIRQTSTRSPPHECHEARGHGAQLQDDGGELRPHDGQQRLPRQGERDPHADRARALRDLASRVLRRAGLPLLQGNEQYGAWGADREGGRRFRAGRRARREGHGLGARHAHVLEGYSAIWSRHGCDGLHSLQVGLLPAASHSDRIAAVQRVPVAALPHHRARRTRLGRTAPPMAGPDYDGQAVERVERQHSVSAYGGASAAASE